MYIPKQRAQHPREIPPTDPVEFAKLLTEKLEKVLAEREAKERLAAKLRKVEVSVSWSLFPLPLGGSCLKMSSAENQKGVNAVQPYSVENQRGASAIDYVQQ